MLLILDCWWPLISWFRFWEKEKKGGEEEMQAALKKADTIRIESIFLSFLNPFSLHSSSSTENRVFTRDAYISHGKRINSLNLEREFLFNLCLPSLPLHFVSLLSDREDRNWQASFHTTDTKQGWEKRISMNACNFSFLLVQITYCPHWIESSSLFLLPMMTDSKIQVV